MSKWLHMNNQRIDYVIKKITSVQMMGFEPNDLDLNEIIHILNSSRQEIKNLDSQLKSTLSENEMLRRENLRLNKVLRGEEVGEE